MPHSVYIIWCTICHHVLSKLTQNLKTRYTKHISRKSNKKAKKNIFSFLSPDKWKGHECLWHESSSTVPIDWQPQYRPNFTFNSAPVLEDLTLWGPPTSLKTPAHPVTHTNDGRLPTTVRLWFSPPFAQ